MAKILSLALTLAAYSDTYAGFWLRWQMVKPIRVFDPDLAAYIAYAVHF